MYKAKYYLPSLFFMTFIFYLSSRQRVEVSEVYLIQFAIFKTLHVIEYGFLYIINYRALKNLRRRPAWQNQIDAFIITFFYAITDEIHQVFVPTREGRMRDIVIDLIGIIAALWYIWEKLPKAQGKLKSWANKLELV